VRKNLWPRVRDYRQAHDLLGLRRRWLDETCNNVRVHGTTGERPVDRLPLEGLRPAADIRLPSSRPGTAPSGATASSAGGSVSPAGGEALAPEGAGLQGIMAPSDPRVRFQARVREVAATIRSFEELLDRAAVASEEDYHAFLKAHPLLLDAYCEILSKPRWHYHQGESPLNKEYVEPDFVIKYLDGTYRLVELEKPRNIVGTQKGHTRTDLTMAAFQIAEWRDYIARHYDILKNELPGIQSDCPGRSVISRVTQEDYGRDLRRQLGLARQQLRVDEIFTYDDLVERARQALNRLSEAASSTN
jgi:Domain of unknown function (DUF4263)